MLLLHTFSTDTIYIALIVLALLFIVVLYLFVYSLRRQRRRDREALAALQAKNEEISQLKESFIANMTHEIRTPLNGIVGFATMLADYPELDVETRAHCKREIEENKTHVLQLVSDLLDFSRIESGTLDYRDEEVDINAVMCEVCVRENSHAHAEGVEAKVVEHLPDCRMRIDKVRFSQVLSNLVHNALKFTDQGSVNVGCRMLGAGKYYFYVADTGCGMDEEGRKAVFDTFVKMNHNIKGTGLGLSISKAIVEHYGGGIGVESKQGEGSTFYFTLPATLRFQEHGKF